MVLQSDCVERLDTDRLKIALSRGMTGNKKYLILSDILSTVFETSGRPRGVRFGVSNSANFRIKISARFDRFFGRKKTFTKFYTPGKTGIFKIPRFRAQTTAVQEWYDKRNNEENARYSEEQQMHNEQTEFRRGLGLRQFRDYVDFSQHHGEERCNLTIELTREQTKVVYSMLKDLLGLCDN